MKRTTAEELLSFPCDFMFKAVGPAGDEACFALRVRQAVSRVVDVPQDAIRLRNSSGGSYLAVSVVVQLHNRSQLEKIYAELRRLDDLKFLI